MKKQFIIVTLFSLLNIMSFGQDSDAWKKILSNSTTFKIEYHKGKIPLDIINQLFDGLEGLAEPKEKMDPFGKGKPHMQLKWFAVDKDENYIIFVTTYGYTYMNLCFLLTRNSKAEPLVAENIQGNLNFKEFKTVFFNPNLKVHEWAGELDLDYIPESTNKNHYHYLSNRSKVKKIVTSKLKSGIDSANFSFKPSRDLLPPEFNSPALENEYYCTYADYTEDVSVIRLRDNQAFIYETYYYQRNYKPYNWSRITFVIGNYRISSDTIYIEYKQLLKGNPEYHYIFPTTLVSWSPPRPPAYLLIKRRRLHDPIENRSFKYLADKPQFTLKRPK
jgi:hypothetical protein